MSWKNLLKPPGRNPKDVKEWLGLMTDMIKTLKRSENWWDDVNIITTVDIVDDLTTGGRDKMLSSEQGKLLHEKTEELSSQLETNTNLIIPRTFSIFKKGEYLSNSYFRCPTVCILNSGREIAFSDMRRSDGADTSPIDIVYKVSDDGGVSWSNLRIVLERHAINPGSRVMDSFVLYNNIKNRLFIFGRREDSNSNWWEETNPNNLIQDFVYKYSDDNGDTWSDEISLNHLKPENACALGASYGSGIVMKDGTLVVPVIKNNLNSNPIRQTGLIISKDNGITWSLTNFIPSGVGVTDECSVVEIENGKLLLNCRSTIGVRRVFTTTDLGLNYLPHITDKKIIEPGACYGSLVKIKNGVNECFAFCNPKDKWERTNYMVRTSKDCVNWVDSYSYAEDRTVNGYSVLANNNNKTVLVSEELGTIIYHDLEYLISKADFSAIEDANIVHKDAKSYLSCANSRNGKYFKIFTAQSISSNSTIEAKFSIQSFNSSKCQSGEFLLSFTAYGNTINYSRSYFYSENLINMKNEDIFINFSVVSNNPTIEVYCKANYDYINISTTFNSLTYHNKVRTQPDVFVYNHDKNMIVAIDYDDIPNLGARLNPKDKMNMNENKKYYIDFLNGNDLNNGLANNTARQNLQTLLNSLSKTINEDIVIRIINSDSNADITINFFNGCGSLTIESDGNGVKEFKTLLCNNNTLNRININYISTADKKTIDNKAFSYGYLDNTSIITNSYASTLAASEIGIWVRNSNVYITEPTLLNKTNAIYVTKNSKVTSKNAKTTDSSAIINAYVAEDGGIIILNNIGTLNGINRYVKNYGGLIISNTGTLL